MSNLLSLSLSTNAGHSIRYQSEFEPLLLLKTPLLANFTYRGDPRSDKLTGALNRIVADETEFRISLVDIEADEPDIRDLMLRYSVCLLIYAQVFNC